MKAFLRYFVLVFLVITLSSATSHAQSFEQRTQANIDSLRAARAKLSQSDRKIQSQIYDVITRYNRGIVAGESPKEAARKCQSPFRIDSSQSIYVMITTTPTSGSQRASIEEAIHSNGGVVHSAYSTVIYASIPISAIRTIAALSQVGSISPFSGGGYWQIISAGYTQLDVNQAYSTYGVTGQGVTIGVISNGVNDITTVENAGELPIVTIRNAGGTGSADNEGTAMLEIVHDLAPNASLVFYGLGDTPTYESLANGVNALDNAGCRIIVDDAFDPNEPYFSDDNDLGAAIHEFITGATGSYSGGTWTGGTYVTAAGNGAQDLYGGTGNFGSGSTNTFQDGKSYLQISVPPGSYPIVLQWKDSWLTPLYDWNLQVEDANGTMIGSSEQTQGPGVPPIERVNVTNTSGSNQTYRIILTASNGASELSIPFKIFAPGCTVTDNTIGNEVFGHAAYPGVVSVAAYESDAQTTIASYSSRGPATMYSSETLQWQTENVPTITATSKVETYVGSSDLWIENGQKMDPFDGTSAAAPAIAAIAALFFQAHGSLGNQDFYNDLIATGTAVGSNPGDHNWYADAGYGKANALALLQKAASTVATPVFAPPSGEVAYPLTVAISSATQGADIYYTEDGSDPTQSSNLYSAPVSVPSGVSNITFKAKAFPNSSQTGLNASDIATATYVVSTDASPTVLPVSGTYYSVVTGKVTFPAGYVLYYYVDSPGSGGHGDVATSTSPWYPVWGPASAYQGTHTYVFSLANPNTGTWGPSVSVKYTLNPGVVVRQEYQKDVGFLDNITTPTLPWSIYQLGQWENYTGAVGFAAPTSSTNWYLLANRSWYPGTNQKYWEWKNISQSVSVPNYAQIAVDQNTSEIDGVFQATADANLQSQLMETGALGGYVNFYDPWYPDENDPTYGLRNRGASAIAHQIYYSSNVQYNIGTGSPNMGVFTGQGGPPNWTGTSYSINAPQTQTVGGHNAQFTGWSVSPSTSVTFQNASVNKTGVVFNSPDAVITANYKGLQLSNDASAYSDNSQRKMIRTQNGYFFETYTDAGHVWLEYSNDNGRSWTLGNGGQPLDGTAGGKCPSITFIYYPTWGISYVGVVWQQKSGSNYTIQGQIFNQLSSGGIDPSAPATLYSEPNDLYGTNANPNLIMNGTFPAYYFVTFEKKNTSGDLQPGIDWIAGNLQNMGGGQLQGPFNYEGQSGWVQGTNANSISAAVALYPGDAGSYTSLGVQLVYQDDYSPQNDQSQIRQAWVELDRNSQSATPGVTLSIRTHHR